MMKKLFGAAFALLFALSALAQQTGEWTGYITDEHCKKRSVPEIVCSRKGHAALTSRA